MTILAQDMNDADQQREIAFWRGLPVWRRMQIIGDLYEAAEVLALADLRRHYPGEADEQLAARLIERRKRLEAHERAS